MLILVSQRGCLADALIIVQVFDRYFRAQCLDIVESGLAGPLRHQDNAALSEFSRSPRDSASVIAVGSGDKCGASKLFAEFFRLQD